MKNIAFLVVTILCLGTGVIVAQKANQEWYASVTKVRLLISSYEEVTEVFGRPAKDPREREYGEEIGSSEGKFFVTYASGKCVEESGESIGWKVPEWTVIEISFTPRKPIKLGQLPFPRTGFRSYPVFDVPGAYEFENGETGVSYGLNRDGRVESISFSPPESMQHLHC